MSRSHPFAPGRSSRASRYDNHSDQNSSGSDSDEEVCSAHEQRLQNFIDKLRADEVHDPDISLFRPPSYYNELVRVSIEEPPVRLASPRPSSESISYWSHRRSRVVLLPMNFVPAQPTTVQDSGELVRLEYIVNNTVQYSYRHPPQPLHGEDLLSATIDAFFEFRHRGNFATRTLAGRRAPPPVATFPALHDQPIRGRERTIIRSVRLSHKTNIHEMLSVPWEQLDEGVVVDCVGAMTGNWEVSSWRYRDGKWTIMLWISMDTSKYTVVRILNRHVHPPCLGTRVRTFARSVSGIFSDDRRRILVPRTIKVGSELPPA
ncbi:hypothetical protein B0H17DRAFT_1205218 [Mycena rosella]|uniref:Uncharacterized protein n=1 Tax=Mycena rosella TaxID=1033263 RepID=A0AAD7D7Q0_MYCRO|nr:hypothetical protein B0H17DRAFT_1205218 [Mycena rosella]